MGAMANKKKRGEYAVFEDALKTVISVPRSEMQRREREYQDQRQKEKRPKPSGASRASHENE